MSTIKPIRNDQDHRDALVRISQLIDQNPPPGSQECDELEVLGTLILFYEREEWKAFKKSAPLEVIRYHMERLGWTQAELARRSTIYSSHLSSVLSGKRRLSMSQCKKLSVLFGVPVDHFIENEYVDLIEKTAP